MFASEWVALPRSGKSTNQATNSEGNMLVLHNTTGYRYTNMDISEDDLDDLPGGQIEIIVSDGLRNNRSGGVSLSILGFTIDTL